MSYELVMMMWLFISAVPPHFEYSQFSVNPYMHMLLLLFLLTLWLHTARKRPWGMDILHKLLCDFFHWRKQTIEQSVSFIKAPSHWVLVGDFGFTPPCHSYSKSAFCGHDSH